MLFINLRSVENGIIRERKWVVLFVFFAACNVGIVFAEHLMNINMQDVSALYPFLVLLGAMLVAVLLARRERARTRQEKRPPPT